MEGQYIVDAKNSYVSKLLSNKKINEAGRILKTKTYEPIFKPQEVHPESSPNVLDDINLPLDEIANDLKILDDQISIATFNIRNYINTTVERLNYSKRLLIEEMQRKQDAEILCKKYDSFLQVIDLTDKEFYGNFHCEDNIFSAEIIGHTNVNYKIVSIEGNGYEGNKYVLTSDGKYLKNFIDTSNREFINDKNNTTLYEYSRITVNDSEKRYCEDANKDTIEAKCIITIEAEDYINCLRLISENKQLKLNEVLISEDGIRFTQVFKETIDINNINLKTEIDNYIPQSGLICFPSTRFVRLALESCGYNGDKLGFDATGVEDEFENKTQNITKELKQLEKNHVFKIKLKDGINKDSINKNNISIVNLNTNKEVKINISYDTSTSILTIRSDKDFDSSEQFLLSIQNLKNKSGNKSQENFKIYFSTKDTNLIYFQPKYFIKSKQKIKLDLKELSLDQSSLTSDFVYVLDKNDEVVEVDFSADSMANTLSFSPKRSYEQNSEYRLFICKGTKTSNNQDLKNSYCMKFKTQEALVEHKKDLFMATINSVVYNNIGYDLDLDNSKYYVIDENNDLINVNITQSERDVNEIKIDTSSFEKDKEYYCVFDSNSRTTMNKTINKQLMFKIVTENAEKIYLNESYFVPSNKDIEIKISYDIDKSYTGLDYIYVINKYFNKVTRCFINYDSLSKTILVKAPMEGYSNLSDYYVIISKDTLTSNLRPIGKTIIKHFKTASKNINTKKSESFLDINEDIVIGLDQPINDKSNIYVIDNNNMKLDYSLIKTDKSIIIKKPEKDFPHDLAFKLIIENFKDSIVYNLRTRPSIQDITFLQKKFFVPLNYRFKIKLNGLIKSESKDDVYIVDDNGIKIDSVCRIDYDSLYIETVDRMLPDSEYKLVLDKSFTVNNVPLKKYTVCCFTTAKANASIQTVKTNKVVTVTYNERIKECYKKDISIVDSNYTKVDFDFVVSENEINISIKDYSPDEIYTIYLSDLIDINGKKLQDRCIRTL